MLCLVSGARLSTHGVSTPSCPSKAASRRMPYRTVPCHAVPYHAETDPLFKSLTVPVSQTAAWASQQASDGGSVQETARSAPAAAGAAGGSAGVDQFQDEGFVYVGHAELTDGAPTGAAYSGFVGSLT